MFLITHPHPGDLMETEEMTDEEIEGEKDSIDSESENENEIEKEEKEGEGEGEGEDNEYVNEVEEVASTGNNSSCVVTKLSLMVVVASLSLLAL